MKFILTNHAKTRIHQRSLELPSQVDLRLVKNKIRKKVRNLCAKNGIDSELVYWRTNETYPTIYVCKIIGVSKYKVITAFRLSK